MRRRTKIVCTIGPTVDSRASIRRLISAGMNVARLNCSYGDWETRSRWVRWIRELSPDTAPVAILVDLQGPKFRLGDFPGSILRVQKGDVLSVGQTAGVGIPLPHPELIVALRSGDRVLLGEGDLAFEVVESGRSPVLRALTSGQLRSRMGVTVPGRVIDTPALTEKDLADIEQACRLGADYLALSYVRSSADVLEAGRRAREIDPHALICAKIETPAALDDLGAIVEVSDAVMVARGDLGIQMPLEAVPLEQKRIIETANTAAKPVITATQMLESMVRSPRPTRAEAADVANAVLDGADALMLSGETAMGDHPVESVRTMARIAARAERLLDEEQISLRVLRSGLAATDPEYAVAFAAAQIARLTRADAILTTTTSGQTARLVARFRPRAPLLCATWSERTRAQMALVWGAEAICVPPPETTDQILENSLDGFRRRKRLKAGDRVVVIAGVPAGRPGSTNMILNLVLE
jgi:pyruvate kinase